MRYRSDFWFIVVLLMAIIIRVDERDGLLIHLVYWAAQAAFLYTLIKEIIVEGKAAKAAKAIKENEDV